MPSPGMGVILGWRVVGVGEMKEGEGGGEGAVRLRVDDPDVQRCPIKGAGPYGGGAEYVAYALGIKDPHAPME